MNVTISEGDSFLICDEAGDVIAGKEAGLYGQDTRFLSRYEMFVDGKKATVFTGRPVSFHASVHYMTNPHMEGFPDDGLTISRERFVGNGLHEDIDVFNHTLRDARFTLRLEFDTDFADIFDVKVGRVLEPVKPEFAAYENRRRAVFQHKSDGFFRRTEISFERECDWDGSSASFEVRLEPGGKWHTCIDFATLAAEPEIAEPGPKYSCGAFLGDERAESERRKAWIATAPVLTTDYDFLAHAYEQSLEDLDALRLTGSPEMESVIAAGMPWFVALFGRDALITAYQALPFLPDLAYGTLRALAKYQGRELDPFSEEEPGKILHELREARPGTVQRYYHERYYGTVDATPLFVILLAEAFNWTGDRALVEELREPLARALAWMDDYGDKDGDGYIEYERATEDGLENQGWKDSYDAVRFADGSFAEPPIALCEVQGYAYAARLSAADLMDELGEAREASVLRERAGELKKRFNRDFWMPHAGCYAQALDGRKRQVDSVTSNAGHLLWSGIADGDKAGRLAQRLLADDMFSGWGIRTMSSQMAAYNPASYHNGSVWPHDNAIIARGLAAYGFNADALRVIAAIMEAGQYFAYQRLPEHFCGYGRSSSQVPVANPRSSSPQAWASGASMLMLSAILGTRAEARRQELLLSPAFPSWVGSVRLSGLRFGGSRVSFEVVRRDGEMRLEALEKPDSLGVRFSAPPTEWQAAG
ncbi:MAG: amylo-alpha-1,6-glucosidase [Actinobacteria bacterium]|nr:MAG: amylo-alpha-1,6-glucosidase [Actinomycetota bacterium]